MKRGRPSSPIIVEPSKKFTHVVKYDDGIVVTWTYNYNKFTNGPVQVDITYPKDYKDLEEIQENLPKTQRTYLNPKNGKTVGYGRAKQLGLID